MVEFPGGVCLAFSRRSALLGCLEVASLQTSWTRSGLGCNGAGLACWGELGLQSLNRCCQRAVGCALPGVSKPARLELSKVVLISCTGFHGCSTDVTRGRGSSSSTFQWVLYLTEMTTL